MDSKRPRAIRSDRRFRFDAPPEAVWALLRQVERYRAWWPWLRAFDGRDLRAGHRWSCTVQPPLPYRVRFTIDLDDVVAGTSVAATVGGDITGPARIELVSDGPATVLVLTAELRAERTWLRLLERWARPVARFGHDQIIDRALADLAARVAQDDRDDR